MLSGRLRLPRLQRYAGRIIAAMGVATFVFGLVLTQVSHRGSVQLFLGVLVIVTGAVTHVWAPKQMRHNVEWAPALNKEDDAVK